MDGLTQDRLKALVTYDEASGVFIWLSRPLGMFPGERYGKTWNSHYAGSIAGRIRADGYRAISIENRLYKAHRLAWLYVHGFWPPNEIDHINGGRDDNRISNLRSASRTQNMRNIRISASNTSGVMGVRYHTRMQKWAAQIRVEKKNKHLGYYKTIDEAAAARLSAERLHGFHKNHGRAA